MCLFNNCTYSNKSNYLITSENTSTQPKPTAIPQYSYENNYIRNNLLTEQEIEFYDAVYAAMINKNEEIRFETIDYTFSSNEEIENMIQNVIVAVIYDNPDIFWYDYNFSYACKDDYNAKSLIITLNFLYEYDEIEEMISEIEEVANDIVRETSYMDEYEKSKYVYTYIAQNTVYKKSSNMNNIYGVLVEGRAVCEGYAKTYCYLMKKCGIESAVITGMSKNQAHAWNIVKINNRYYYVDNTWGDPIIEGDRVDPLYVDYSYLHLPYEDISVTHIEDELYNDIHKNNDLEDNFYVKEALCFSKYDENIIYMSLRDEIESKNNEKGDIIILKFPNKYEAEKAKEFIVEQFRYFSADLKNKIYEYSLLVSENGAVSLILYYE